MKTTQLPNLLLDRECHSGPETTADAGMGCRWPPLRQRGSLSGVQDRDCPGAAFVVKTTSQQEPVQMRARARVTRMG